jgi:S1-C subfamily serine protease
LSYLVTQRSFKEEASKFLNLLKSREIKNMSQKAVYQLSGRQILLIAFASALIAVGITAAFSLFGGGVFQAQNLTNVAMAEDVPKGLSDPSAVTDEQNSIEVYRTLSPGVAFISTTSIRQDFWGGTEEGQGTGSGSVIDRQGHILTNNHVIEGASKLTVSFGGDKVYPARVVGRDPDTDLAVIKIDPPREGLTVIPLGDSDKLSVGQKVLAIGNPFGLDRTLTTGIISGLQRPIRARNGRPIDAAIQTDASINQGNSGGPLLDKFGRMIGINSQILSPSGGSVGVGFAVPVNTAKRVIPQLIQFGLVNRPKLGVGGIDVSRLSSQGLRLAVESGVLIRSVAPGGAAANAGLRGFSYDATGEIVLGDIITALNGEKIENQDDLYRQLDKYKIGDTVQIEVFRSDKRLTVPVRLTAAPPTRSTRGI